MKTKLFVNLILMLVASLPVFGQVAINTTGNDPDPSAMLDISATDKGILIPRLTTSQRNNISNPATGLVVYDTDLQSFIFYNGTEWVFVSDVKEIDDLLDGATPGSSVYLGDRAGMNDDGTNSNVGIGEIALLNNTSGDNNVAVGYAALLYTTTGGGNVGVGTRALMNNTEGENNVAIGTSALDDNETGDYNIAIGFAALTGSSSGTRNFNYNIGIGTGTLDDITTGSYNIAIGWQANQDADTGTDNIAIFGLKFRHTGQQQHRHRQSRFI